MINGSINTSICTLTKASASTLNRADKAEGFEPLIQIDGFEVNVTDDEVTPTVVSGKTQLFLFHATWVLRNPSLRICCCTDIVSFLGYYPKVSKVCTQDDCALTAAVFSRPLFLSATLPRNLPRPNSEQAGGLSSGEVILGAIDRLLFKLSTERIITRREVLFIKPACS